MSFVLGKDPWATTERKPHLTGTGYLQLPLPGEQLLVSLLELVLPLLGVQVLDQLGLGGHGRRTLARPPHQAARPLELQHEIFFL